MFRTAIASGESRQGIQEIDPGEAFKEITGAYRACLHDLRVGIMARIHGSRKQGNIFPKD